MRKSMTSDIAEEVFLGPRLVAWLPEAEWEWHDRVRSNLWPCEFIPERRERPAPPSSPKVTLPEDER
jgi:hypothetical protein